MERLNSPSNYPPAVGRFTPEQIANRSTWAGVPDANVQAAAMHIIHVRPANGSTVTEVNPLDPATTSDGTAPQWLHRPADTGRVVPTRSAR